MLTVSETAKLLRVGTKSLYAAIKKKTLPGAIKVGGSIRINERVLLNSMGADTEQDNVGTPKSLEGHSG